MRKTDEVLFQFDKFLLDTERRELSGGDGGTVHVEPQVFDLLLHLVWNANRVVSKDELIERVWNGRAVSDAALNSRINAARRAIGDTGERQAIIRTVQRRGFLLAAEVRTGASGAAVATRQHDATPPGSALPDNPSRAVMPFENLCGNPAQD